MMRVVANYSTELGRRSHYTRIQVSRVRPKGGISLHLGHGCGTAGFVDDSTNFRGDACSKPFNDAAC